jgi:hypothetical protein
LLLVGLRPAAAVTIDNLYEAQAIVTGTGEKNRLPGLVQCLEDVLVRVSGDPRLIGDPTAIALGKNVGDYVSSFRYRDRMEGIPIHDEQGSHDRPHDLTVDFDPAKIDTALHALGREPWTSERPQLVVFLGVTNAKGSFVLTADGDESPYMGESLAAASTRMAVPTVLPRQAELKKSGLTVDALAESLPADLDARAKEAGGDKPLIGSLVWSDEELGWIADWRIEADGKAYQWQARGISFDAAFRNAMRGAAQILSGHGAPKPNAP